MFSDKESHLSQADPSSEGLPKSRRWESVVDRIWAFMKRPWIAAIFIFLVLLALVTENAELDTDLFHRVAVGRLVELNGGVVHQDPFSFSPRLESWVDHEWLSGVAFYQLASLGGDFALLAFDLAAMLLTILLIVWAQKRLLGKDEVILPWLLLTLLPLFLVWVSVVRCRVFTFLFLSILFSVLIRWREGDRRWLWVLPPLYGVWMNLHGGVVAGLGLFGVAAAAATVESPRRSLALWGTLAASAVFTLVNPYGTGLWAYLFNAATMDRPGIAEWDSIPIGSFFSLIPVLVVAAVVAGSMFSRKKPPLETWALIGVSLVAAYWSQRILLFLLMVLAIFGAPSIRDLGEKLKSIHLGFWMAGQRVATVLFLCLFAFSGLRSAQGLHRIVTSGVETGGFPVDAVEWLDQHGGGGKLLVHFNHGSFALWRLYPAYTVSVDGRYEEVYPQSTVDLARQALDPRDPDHLEALSTLDPDYILFPPVGGGDAFPGEWKVVYEDDLARIMARNHAPPQVPREKRGMWEPAF